MARNIAFFGDAYADLSLYVGNILGALGESVLIVDAVSNRPIDYCIDTLDGIDVKNDIYRFKRVDYTRLENVPSSSHSVVITLYGTEVPDEAADVSIFAVTETSEGYMKMLKNEYPLNDSAVLVVRDSNGLAKKEFKAFAKAKKIKEVNTIKVNKRDIKAKLELEFCKTIRVSQTSGELQKLIFAICQRIKPDLTEKMFDKAMKVAEKGVK